MELSTIRDSFERVAKKQKLSISRSQEVIDQVGSEIEQASTRIQSSLDSIAADQKSIFMDLKFKLNSIDPLRKLEETQMELNTNLSKLIKQLGKSFDPDISKAYRHVDFDFHILNQLIASHFYREGLFDIGDGIIQEAGEPKATALKCHFVQMYQILEAVKVRNLEPALKWVCTNHEKLKENNFILEFKLHCLQFVEILQKGTRAHALNYARTYLASFASLHEVEFQKLMCSLLWSGRLDKSPYSGLLSPTHWEKLPEELIGQFCCLLGQSYESPLSLALKAGFEGLLTLLKLANLMAVQKQDWQAMKNLPVPVELGKEFQFHSIFVCPVSRDQSSEENPPMLMPCLHVLCRQSIMKLSKSISRTFKCPYCPWEASVSQCKQLHF